MAVSPEQAKALAMAAARKRQAEQQQSQPGTPRSALRQAGHDFAYDAGQLYKGVMGTLALPIDMLGGVVNYLETKTQGPTYEVTIDGKKYTRTRGEAPTANETLDAGLRAVGVPVDPESRGEEVRGSVYRSLGGAGTGVGVGTQLAKSASPVVAGVGETLASNPIIQGVSAVTAPLSAEAAKEMGAGPGGQFVAGLAGALAPSVVASAAPALVRAGFRGGEQGRQRVAENINTFRTAGTTPTVGQATEGRAARATETLLSRAPGGAGVVARRAQQQADDVGQQLERQAQALVGRATSAEQTGRQIQQSIRGEGGFVETFKNRQTQLYDKLDQFIPSSSFVRVDRTQQALQSLNSGIPGAPNVSKFFTNATIRDIETALKSDLQPDGTLPYEALKKLRTMVGGEIADSGITSTVPRSKWRALYAALSDDLGISVEDNPAAQAAWTRANNYSRAGMRRIEAIESVLERSGGPEAIFRAATSGTREGASTLRAVMQSVDDDGRRMITATVLRRLGLAKAGVQGELGDQFSAESFLTNWNMLSREAKTTLFNRYGAGFRQDMDQVARYAANLREGSQVFRNPSGTSQGVAQGVLFSSVFASLTAALTGHVAAGAAGLAGAGASVAGANRMAALMTNPRFVKWLAQTTKVPQGARAAMVNNLAQEAQSSGDLDLARAVVVLQQEPNEGGNRRNDQQR